MAARTHKIRHDEETRAKIQVAQIINRFMACLNGEIELNSNQVSCGKTLLAKVLPDLTSTEMKVETTRYVAEIPQVAENTEEWLRQAQRKTTAANLLQ